MMILNNITEAIGNTPLVALNNIKKELNLKANIFAKVELTNPGGSIKDRVAIKMIEDYKNAGVLNGNTTIIEPTSGNTGIGLCVACSAFGYKLKIVMPDNMSKERIMLMRAYGAEVILTDGALGMQGAIDKAKELKKKIPNSIIAGQFENMSNPDAHYYTTGPEIYSDAGGCVDILVCGVGTGGTITGAGKYLKEQNANVRVVAIEPYNSAVLSGQSKGAHGLQGIGAGFVPRVLDTSIYDEIIKVRDEEAFEITRLLAKKEGILCGISSGAALFGAITLAKKEKYKDYNIVVILPDTGTRYLSSNVF
ncbi:MAG: cysteine synthase A [Clostridia bacterium]|nr:cysteine synthase A [Clostridia bacterium]